MLGYDKKYSYPNPIARFLVKSVIGFFFLISFVTGYGSFCDSFFSQKQYLDLSEKKQWVLAQQGGSYDYAVLGSSRAFGAFDMNLLDSLSGWNGINLGSNGSGFKDNYLVLALFLKSNKIKRLFLQVDMGSLNSKSSFSNEFHAFTFMPYWEEPEVREVLKAEIPLLDNPISSTFPQWRYFYFNKYFSPKEVWRRVMGVEQSEDRYKKVKGGMQSSAIRVQFEETEIKLYSQPENIDKEDFDFLNRIVQLTKTQNIHTTLFVAPRYESDNQKLKAVLGQYSNATIFPEGFDESDRAMFQDQGHLSEYGRFLFTKMFFEKFDKTEENISL